MLDWPGGRRRLNRDASRYNSPVTPPLPLPIRLITDSASLTAACATWATAPVLAFDTEFVRERTFFQRLGLIQVCDGTSIALVDPVACPDLEPFAAVLCAANVLKVVHSASEDIEVCFHRLEVLPAPLFDTQVAAGLAGLPPSLGYGKLVHEILGLELSKGETRTDWLARPLSAAQLSYAADDVLYLLPIFERLREILVEKDRFSWALEDSAALLDPARFSDEPERAYLRLKEAPRLTRRQLGAAQALAAWREREARGRDIPRTFLLRDDLLVSLARRPPKDLGDLQARSSYDARTGARHAGAWLEVLRLAEVRPDAELPDLLWSPKSDAASRKAEDLVREQVRRRAEALGVPAEVLAPRRLLTSLAQVRAGADAGARDWLDGWRGTALRGLLDPVAGENS